jgi:dipeptidyl aminopeptidase/acylaminoacyl peptidase
MSPARALLVGLLALSALAPAARAATQPYHELGLPSGRHAARPPVAGIIVIHGGGWAGVGNRTTASMRDRAQYFNARGYETLNIDYRPGTASLHDVNAFYDMFRVLLGRGTPICAYGESAGGHLALMLASDRPSLRCVIALAAPTDLASLPPTGLANAQHAFGLANLVAWSPALQEPPAAQPVLLANAVDDPVVPFDQAYEFWHHRPHGTTVFGLEPGPVSWVHSDVSLDSLLRLARTELAFLRTAVRRGSS